MPRPLNERQALEQERAERREFLMWQIRQEKLTAGGDRGKAGHAQLQGGRVTRAQRAGLRLEGVPRPSLATRIRRYKLDARVRQALGLVLRRRRRAKKAGR